MFLLEVLFFSNSPKRNNKEPTKNKNNNPNPLKEHYNAKPTGQYQLKNKNTQLMVINVAVGDWEVFWRSLNRKKRKEETKQTKQQEGNRTETTDRRSENRKRTKKMQKKAPKTVLKNNKII